MENKNYKILEAQKRKEWAGKHGPMVDYAVKLEGVDEWVQLTQKPETPEPTVGSEIFGRTWVQTNGDKSYLRFKKENPNGGGYQKQDGSAVGSVMDLEYMLKLLEAIAFEVGGTAQAAIRRQDVVVEDIDDKPIDLSEIPF